MLWDGLGCHKSESIGEALHNNRVEVLVVKRYLISTSSAWQDKPEYRQTELLYL